MDTKAIFITGGAGGMGLATGQRFAEAGWRVGLFDLDAAALAAAKAAMGSEAVMTGVLDVTDADAFSEAVKLFSAWSGDRMDILFNNAGIAPGGLLEEMSDATIRAVIEVNVFGVINGIRAALPLLKSTDNALCISTSSSVATFGHAMRAVYTASKFAVKGLTEALSLELEQYRLMPASAIADAVWAAYHNSDPIHFYVPEEVGDTDRVKATDIQAARSEIKDFLFRGR